MTTNEKMLLAALECAVDFIGELGRNGVSVGVVPTVPRIITDALRIAKVEDTREKDTFTVYAPTFDLSPDDFGRTFRFRSRTYKIVGCRPKSFKFPILGARMPDGKVFKFPADHVAKNLVKV